MTFKVGDVVIRKPEYQRRMFPLIGKHAYEKGEVVENSLIGSVRIRYGDGTKSLRINTNYLNLFVSLTKEQALGDI